MIKFFRQIRFNLLRDHKPGRYLKYAVGEIVLVVIGILIALQINDWNERRKNELKETRLINNIIEDLKLDSIHINRSLNELEAQLHVVDELIARTFDQEKELNDQTSGLVRYSSDFRPISQRNHAESVSNLENEFTRELLQSYFLKEDQVKDIFLEYEDIIHNKIRPYLSDQGMHNLKALYKQEMPDSGAVLLYPSVLEQQLDQVKFQQLMFERRLKTGSFETLLIELKRDNSALINTLSLNNQ